MADLHRCGRTPRGARRPTRERILALGILVSWAAAALPGCAAAGGEDGERPFHASVQATESFGPVSGFVQTPKGGNPGSSSAKRPTLKELGFRTAASPDLRIVAGRGDDEFLLDARQLHLSGSRRLDDALVSHGQSFPAGAAVHARIDADEYRLGYGRRFALSPGDGSSITLVPTGGLAFWKMDYRLSSGSLPAQSRGYGHAAAFLGTRIEWNRGGPVTLSASALPTLPLATSPLLLPVDVEAGLRLWEGGELLLGAEFERARYQDNQALPNRVRIDRGPALSLGLKVDF